ncbi:MAG: 50S ribosomal protein L4 [Cytophagales bacterium]|nr:MAG: 50S ribosomal protein L4 [Cytophagales bacterium]
MELSVLNNKGIDTGRKVIISESIYSTEPNDHAIYLDVKQYLANQRQGTHKAKERNEVAGSTRKLKKQKGTGGARAGSAKSGTIKGGGRIFGPRPRDYAFKLNKKVKSLARKSAFSYKLKEQAIIVLDAVKFDSPKTKLFVSLLKDLSQDNKKTLFVLDEKNDNAVLASRNILSTQVVQVEDLCTYDILNAEKIVLLEKSFSKLESILN